MVLRFRCVVIFANSIQLLGVFSFHGYQFLPVISYGVNCLIERDFFIVSFVFIFYFLYYTTNLPLIIFTSTVKSPYLTSSILPNFQGLLVVINEERNTVCVPLTLLFEMILLRKTCVDLYQFYIKN